MELAEEATNTSGNALKNQEKYQESYAGKLQEIQTQMQDFWLKVLNNDTFKSVLDFVIELTKGINKLADSTSAFGIVLSGVLGGSVVSTAMSKKFLQILGLGREMDKSKNAGRDKIPSPTICRIV